MCIISYFISFIKNGSKMIVLWCESKAPFENKCIYGTYIYRESNVTISISMK